MKLLAVIGMHRSGTSLVTSMLRAAGWDVGPDEQLMPARPDNPLGFVEHLPAVQLNNRLLRRLGGSWDRPPALLPGWQHESVLDDLRAEATRIVEDLLARPAERVLVKDPRLALTLPFWQTVAEIDDAVHVLRAPDPVVRSLLRREDDMQADRAASLWLRYVLGALRQDVQLHQVAPEEVLDDVSGVLARLATDLGHTPSNDELDRARSQVADHLWGRSSRGDDLELPAEPSVVAARQVHELLTGDAAARWRHVLGQLATVDELVSAGALLDAHRTGLSATVDELRERITGLQATLEATRARADRLLTERERAHALLEATRPERPGA